jgi:hypothetical protein
MQQRLAAATLATVPLLALPDRVVEIVQAAGEIFPKNEIWRVAGVLGANDVEKFGDIFFQTHLEDSVADVEGEGPRTVGYLTKAHALSAEVSTWRGCPPKLTLACRAGSVTMVGPINYAASFDLSA